MDKQLLVLFSYNSIRLYLYDIYNPSCEMYYTHSYKTLYS